MIACKTLLQPDGAPSLTTCLVTPQNLATIDRNHTKVPTCKPKPPIRTLVPTFAGLPSQFPDEAIEVPEAWTRNDRMSKPTKVRVMRCAGIKKMRCLVGGSTARIRRPMRR